MVLTTRAEELIEPVRAVLDQIRTTIAIAPDFDPATCDRQVRIMASDYSTQVLLTGAFADLARVAPHMRFEVMPMDTGPVDLLERGQIDLLLTIDYAISSDHPSQFLFEDDYVVVGDPANPAMQGEMTRDKYFALGHVTARFGRTRTPAFDDWFVRRQKTQRRIEVVAPTFLSQAGLVIGTHRIATMHRRLAQQAVQMMPLVMREVPFDIPPIREAVQWHISNNNDRPLRWVVERLALFAGQERATGNGVVAIDDARHDAIAVQFQANHPVQRSSA
jgi:DNA-binding transcriptional LysR family regulator